MSKAKADAIQLTRKAIPDEERQMKGILRYLTAFIASLPDEEQQAIQRLAQELRQKSETHHHPEAQY